MMVGKENAAKLDTTSRPLCALVWRVAENGRMRPKLDIDIDLDTTHNSELDLTKPDNYRTRILTRPFFILNQFSSPS